MKKIYFISLLLGATSLFAQNKFQETPILPAIEKQVNQKVDKRSHLNKASGDTLWYEDFSGGFATNGWTSVDITQNGFDWIYTTTGPGGQYSATMPALGSVTAANGFASLPSDFYNTPTPPGGFQAMASSITSGPIVINSVSSVLVRWRQAQRYCCSASEQLELQVSNDGFNFVSFDAKFGRQANVFVTEDAEINISSVVANHDTIYLRFYQSASHYYWMIDDIAIVVGPSNQLEITEVFTTFGSNLYEGYYAQVPFFQTQPISFGATIRNASGFDATNVGLEVTISHNSLGQLFNDSSSKVSLFPALTDDTFNVFTPYDNRDGLGMYTATLFARADTVSANPALAHYSIPWTVGDTLFAKDFGNAGGSIGPGSYPGGDNDGSMIGTKYTLKQAWPVNSLSYYIANTVDNVGVEIKAKVWGFDTSQATLNQMISVPGIKAQNPIPYIIQQSDLGTWLTIQMVPPVWLPPGQYIAAIEQTFGNIRNQELRIGRATDIEALQPYGRNFSSFAFGNDSTPAWGNIFTQPMIRMNFVNPLAIGLKENSKMFESNIVPNPSNGQFAVRFNGQVNVNSIQVFSMDGKQVHFMSVGQTTQQIEMDLNELDKGVYFLQINSEQNRVVEKIVIQ